MTIQVVPSHPKIPIEGSVHFFCQLSDKIVLNVLKFLTNNDLRGVLALSRRFSALSLVEMRRRMEAEFEEYYEILFYFTIQEFSKEENIKDNWRGELLGEMELGRQHFIRVVKGVTSYEQFRWIRADFIDYLCSKAFTDSTQYEQFVCKYSDKFETSKVFRRILHFGAFYCSCGTLKKLREMRGDEGRSPSYFDYLAKAMALKESGIIGNFSSGKQSPESFRLSNKQWFYYIHREYEKAFALACKIPDERVKNMRINLIIENLLKEKRVMQALGYAQYNKMMRSEVVQKRIASLAKEFVQVGKITEGERLLKYLYYSDLKEEIHHEIELKRSSLTRGEIVLYGYGVPFSFLLQQNTLSGFHAWVLSLFSRYSS